MKRFIVTILAAASVLMLTAGLNSTASAASRSRSVSVVNIDGARYYIHTIADGDTLYSLAKEYGVTTKEIYKHNPSVRNGYKIGANIKIPYVEQPVKNLSDKKTQRVFDIHSVTKGETIYSISRKYEISVDMILEDNPTVDPAGLAIGQNINVRKSEQGQSSAERSMSELDDYRQQLNKLLDEGLAYHLVAEGDTLDSLRKEFDMVEGEIEDLNDLPIGEPLAVGSLVLVNDLSGDDASRSVLADETEERIYRDVVSSFSALRWGDTLRISLLLPLSIRGYAIKPIVEFYNGFMLGVEGLKSKGRNIEVNLFNTERSRERVAQIVESEDFLNSNLIVGPVYEELMAAVLQSAERRGVAVVSPLASLKQSDSEVLFQVAPHAEHRYNKLAELLAEVGEISEDQVGVESEYDAILSYDDESIYSNEAEEVVYDLYDERSNLERQIIKLDSLAGSFYYEAIERLADFGDKSRSDAAEERAFDEEVEGESEDGDNLVEQPLQGGHRITLIFGESNDEAYREQIEAMLNDLNKSYECFTYNYEHPSAITERERKLEEYIKSIGEDAQKFNCEIDTDALSLLKCRDSKSNLTQLITNGADKNIFFVLSDNETEVDRILSALASAYTTQSSTLRGSGIKPSEKFNFSVIANPEWRGYDNIDKSIFFRDRVVNFPSYLASRDSSAVREFDSNYCEVYDDFPSLYSYRGYDVATIFGEGMFDDIQYGMEGRTYTPLQTKYRFERQELQQGRVNTNWMRVIYNLDYTLTAE